MPVLDQHLARPGVKYRINGGEAITIRAIIGPIGGRQISDASGVRTEQGGDAQVFTANVPNPSTSDKISPDGGVTWYDVNEVGEPKGGMCAIGFVRSRTQEISLNNRGSRSR